ncbi:lipid II flippase MurJ [Kitasatospora griseola]|uniref:lipid II flippase MurJ n=1 Tax=Kitasatospora griseola TaxID=2064 RepID=UPI003855A57D
MTTDQPVAAVTTTVPVPGPRTDGDDTGPRGGFLAKAFGVTALLSAAGSGLGLLRDLLLARYFGANQGTDAFLVAWTVPETAAPLLIEDAMAFLMVPAFSLALVLREERGQGPDPVRQLTRSTLPWLLLALCALSGTVALFAPQLVDLLAPGLADPRLAVTCTRITAVTVVPFGVAGYLASALRALHAFTAPAVIYVMYNLGILALLLSGHRLLGVRSAALGVALGSLLMAGVLVVPFVRRLHARQRRRTRRRGAGRGLVLIPLALLPVAAFSLTRQSQVFIERYLGSALPPGTISHLNYAAKVSQLAMTSAILIVTVTFPVVARAMAAGDLTAARDRVEKDLGQAAALVLLGTAFLLACAPAVAALLFQRGAFGPADTEATAAVIRVYSFGLPAQAMIGVMVRPYFCVRPVVRRADAPRAEGDRTTWLDWYPVGAMMLGLVVTFTLGVTLTPRFGAPGLAAGNAVGITFTAALLMRGLMLRGVALRLGLVLGGQARLLAAAIAAAGIGSLAIRAVTTPLSAALLGGVTVLLVFALLGTLFGVPEVRGPVLALLARARRPHAPAPAEGKPHGR